MKIIDAHMHPFSNENENLKWYLKEETPDFNAIRDDMERAGIYRFCGSVISRGKRERENLINSNEAAFSLYRENSDVYLPGVIIHPDYKEESCNYIKRAYDLGLHLVGELTPYMFGWTCYEQVFEIIEYATSLGMTLSCHPTTEEDMETLAKTFPKTEIVFAHPGDKPTLVNHAERMKKYDNTYIDISGGGFQRYASVKELIRQVGKERVLFGTDYPICNPGAYVGAVMYENLTEDEMEHVFYKNAERVYKMK